MTQSPEKSSNPAQISLACILHFSDRVNTCSIAPANKELTCQTAEIP